MSAGPVVSVVVPVFNGERLVGTALRSVLTQTHPHFEVIVVDDGSTDSSAQVVSSFENVILVRQRNSGVAAARNAGIQRATGDFIAFLDQDDWWLPAKLEEQVRVFWENATIGVVHTAVSYYDDTEGRFVGLLNPNARTEDLVGDCFDRLMLGNALYNSSVVVRRSVLDQVGFCDLNLPGNTVQDYDLWLRCARQTRFAYVARPLTVLRLHPAQGLWNRVAMLSDELAVVLRYRTESEWLSSRERRNRLAGLYDRLAVAYLDCGNPREARRHFAAAWRTARTSRQLARWAVCCLPPAAIQTIRSIGGRARALDVPHSANGSFPK